MDCDMVEGNIPPLAYVDLEGPQITRKKVYLLILKCISEIWLEKSKPIELLSF
jgi:hypothetical protein